ncbi:MAG: OmpH family outer membrane protein [Deltaproteobacteria bacterium]|jgi:outer membrane protein|nr:OmpH family outer membrane protein [Deltaproteobacteria bacterium]
MKRAHCAALLLLTLCGGAARAEGLAVVDVERVFRESAPGKAGEAHLMQARDILQKGFEELRDLFKGKENTAEAEAALREGRAALERQLAADRLAVRQVLAAHLENVVRVWFAANAKGAALRAIAPASAFFVYSPALDVTDAVIREMDKETPSFHALPSVTIKAKPEAHEKASPGKGAGSAAPTRPQGRPRTP